MTQSTLSTTEDRLKFLRRLRAVREYVSEPIPRETNNNILDEGRMAERLALASMACGLGSVIATLKNEGPDEAKKLLGIPEDRRARTLVAIGHTDVEARRALPKNPTGG